MKARSGRYVFLKKLAVGGMAEIFLARRLSLGGFARFVVIKRLLPEHRSRPAYERLFLSEARLTALLDHPNIVSLHDLGQLDDAYYMAMEYVHGVSGAELMSRAVQAHKAIPLGVALRIVERVASALAHCHEALGLDGAPLGVLHHDVSPHNIQVTYNGDVKLLDFGVATRMGEPTPGGRRGKPAYMSPEAIARKPLDGRSDVFSLGVVLYELTVGRRLFKGKSAEESRARAESARIKPPSEILASYPKPLEALVLSALAKEPVERIASASLFKEQLQKLSDSLNLDTSAAAMAAFMSDLYGEEIAVRRAELDQLAQQVSSGSVSSPPTPMPPEELGGRPAPPPLPKEAAGHTPSPLLELPDDANGFEGAEEPSSSGLEAVATEAGVLLSDLRPLAPLAPAPIPPPRGPRLALMGGLVALLMMGAFLSGLLMGRTREEVRLEVRSSPAGAKVFDGDRLLGITPFVSAVLPANATLNLKLQRPGAAAGWSGRVTLPAEGQVRLEIPL